MIFSASTEQKFLACKEKFLATISKLSPKEKGLIGICIFLIFFLSIRSLWLNINAIFTEKEKQFRETEQWRNALPYRITDYLELSAQKNNLEKEYNTIQSAGDVRADLEDLLKKQEGVQKGFSIKALAPNRFADNYEQTPYNIVFSVSDYQSLLNILKELHEGEKPLIIKTIDISKSQGGRFLKIKLDLIGLKYIKR